MKLKYYNDVNDLKKLNNNELQEFAKEVRSAIRDEVMNNEGHLGSNLAIVDITISLLKHFGSEPRYLYDTGYQSYAHKLLTDRPNILENMHTFDGYSVFQEIEEGDPYSGGHTAISAGWASGYKKVDNRCVIEIIGDGSLASSIGLGGMLNFASDTKNKGLFILNDNKQGIGVNKFNYLEWEKIAIGMGFAYYEVENGHDYDQLEKAWSFFDSAKKNVFVKVNTIKAYGIEVKNPKQAMHYYSKPTAEVGVISPIKFSVQQLKKILKDPNAVVFNAGMMYNYNLIELERDFPNQIFDGGISEEIIMVEAAAAANAGKKVYVLINSSFFQRTYDQLVHDLVRNNSDINIFLFGAGYDTIGDSHHGIYDLNMYNIFESIRIFQPTTTGELITLINQLDNFKGLKIIRLEDRILVDDKKAKLEKWVYDTNKDAKKTLITYGSIYYQWKDYIEKNNLKIGLIKARTLNPIDSELVKKLIADKKEIYVYEHVMKKNNLASNIYNCFNEIKIKNFAFENIKIGRANDECILRANKLDFPTVVVEILKN